MNNEQACSVSFQCFCNFELQDVSLASEPANPRHQQKVLHALSQTGLLELWQHLFLYALYCFNYVALCRLLISR